MEAYSESWGPCGSVAPVLRKFLTDVALEPGGLQVLVARAAGGPGLAGRSHAPSPPHTPPSQVKAEDSKLLEAYRNTSVPHFLFFRNGQRVEARARVRSGPSPRHSPHPLRACRPLRSSAPLSFSHGVSEPLSLPPSLVLCCC